MDKILRINGNSLKFLIRPRFFAAPLHAVDRFDAEDVELQEEQAFGQAAKGEPGGSAVRIRLSQNVVIVIKPGKHRGDPVCVLTYDIRCPLRKRVGKGIALSLIHI